MNAMTVKKEVESPKVGGMLSSSNDCSPKSDNPIGGQQEDIQTDRAQNLVIANKNVVEKQQNYGR